MERKEADMLVDAFVAYNKKFCADNDLSYIRTGGSFNKSTGEVVFRMRTVKLTTCFSRPLSSTGLTQEKINLGLAPAGTLIWAEWEEGENNYYLAEIVGFSRNKYIVHFLDEDDNYKIDYTSSYLINPVTKMRTEV